MPRKRPLKNCVLCGRDTSARDGFCARCIDGQHRKRDPRDEERGRRRTVPLDEFDEERDEPMRLNEYHGDTDRDDI